MANIGSFNSDEKETEVGFDPIPPGTYKIMVTNSELKEVKNKPGEKYLKLEHAVLEGPYKGRKIFLNLSLWNADLTAVKIAEGLLAQLCKAANKPKIDDSAELHNIPVDAEIKVREAKGAYSASNEIKNYIFEGSKKKAASATIAQTAKSGAAPWANG